MTNSQIRPPLRMFIAENAKEAVELYFEPLRQLKAWLLSFWEEMIIQAISRSSQQGEPRYGTDDPDSEEKTESASLEDEATIAVSTGPWKRLRGFRRAENIYIDIQLQPNELPDVGY